MKFCYFALSVNENTIYSGVCLCCFAGQILFFGWMQNRITVYMFGYNVSRQSSALFSSFLQLYSRFHAQSEMNKLLLSICPQSVNCSFLAAGQQGSF